MPNAVVRIYKTFAFDTFVEEAKDYSDAIDQAETILSEASLTEAFDRFDGQEVFDKDSDAEVTNFDGEDQFENDDEDG